MVMQMLDAKPWRGMRWLILAPHPDDETLGAAALIAQMTKARCLAGVVYLTDGSGSHEDGGRLVSVRKREAAVALRRLTGSRASPPRHLGWKDAMPFQSDDPRFAQSCRTLTALCQRLHVDAVAVTALAEPHCDHSAAARLAYAVQGAMARRLIVAEYVVWGEVPDRKAYRIVRSAPMPTGKRGHALRAHRSQLTASHGAGFRLPKAQQRMAARDTLYVRRAA